MNIKLILIVVYGVAILVMSAMAVHELTLNTVSSMDLGAACMVIAGLFLELIQPESWVIDKKEDSGIISALLYGGSVISIALCRMLFKTMIFGEPVRILLFSVGSVIFSCGVVVRLVSRKTLGRYFSYALRIEKDHKLIDSGIYSIIRHPAYLGALMTLAGVTLMFGIWLGWFVVFGAMIYTFKRIKREEAILLNHFGPCYRNYMARTRRLIPKVF